MPKLIDVDAFIKQYCENCGFGCELSDACCGTVEDLMNFPSFFSVAENNFSSYEVGDTIRISLPKDKKIMTYNGEKIDFDYEAED